MSRTGIPFEERRDGKFEDVLAYLEKENVADMVRWALKLPVTRVTLEI